LASEKQILEQIKLSGDIPVHIAIIMDGNGRWAKKRGLPRAAGHKRGVDTVKNITENCAELGVKYLTVYTFSTENWNRPKEEVSTLMRLLLNSLKEKVAELNENNIRLTTIGDISSLPYAVQNELKEAIEKTKNNDKMTLNLALSYSGRWELMEAIKSIGKLVLQNKLKVEDINEACVKEHLTTKNIPDPDLLIRTSGEFRVSNFLLWQIAYTEFYISDVFWPDFNKQHLLEAIKSYQNRERRFGRVSNQIKVKKKVKGFNNAHINT